MEEDLVARLVADAGVSAIVDEAVSWFERNRDDALPAVVLQKVSPGREYSHDGPDGLDGPRVQFDCLGRTMDEAAALKRAVLACMEQGATVGDTVFHIAFLEGENWISQGEQDGGEALFQLSLDFIFYHEET
ncbi:MAG: DUF3168 domain-containing protein [Novosphingobium sp.]|uniref:tail completion protein gp17 n=1 Tax=Novosphingobium sp. TaxID=1874826 RepID=UPI0027350436|nr:DUF3168 domain-containing protein [Novosphingobium sp.]MDP3550611.1 DUF3168 domain-containing protein [Novosphingobium sp.]